MHLGIIQTSAIANKFTDTVVSRVRTHLRLDSSHLEHISRRQDTTRYNKAIAEMCLDAVTRTRTTLHQRLYSSCGTALIFSCSSSTHRFRSEVLLRNRRALHDQDEAFRAQIQLPARCDKTTFRASPVSTCEISRLVTLSLAVMALETRSQLMWRRILPTNMRLTSSWNTRAAALVRSDASQRLGHVDAVRFMRK